MIVGGVTVGVSVSCICLLVDGCTAGVADGVGGWRSKGVDPSKFSRLLMTNCSHVLQSRTWQGPSDILEQAHHLVLQSKQVALGK